MKRIVLFLFIISFACSSIFAIWKPYRSSSGYYDYSEQPFVGIYGTYTQGPPYFDEFVLEIYEDRIELSNEQDEGKTSVFFNEHVDVWISVVMDGFRFVGTSTDSGTVIIKDPAINDLVKKLMDSTKSAKDYLVYGDDSIHIEVLVRGTGDERDYEYHRSVFPSGSELYDNLKKLFPHIN